MEAVDVLRRLLTVDLSLPSTAQVELIAHENKLNWRQRNPTVLDQVRNLRQGLAHDGPFHGHLVRVAHIKEEVGLLAGRISRLKVVSVTSRLFDPGGELIGHLAIMNLHPEGLGDLTALAHAVTATTGGMPGYLLASGRYFHFYGKRLLRGNDWHTFLAQFLMPCVLVSPRYIGHSLFRGFCAARLTSARPHKPTVPTLLFAF